MPKRFNLAEAEGLLPEIDKSIREALSRKTRYEEAEATVSAFAQRVTMMGGVVVDRDTVLLDRARRDKCLEQLKESLDEIQEYGCIVKDLDIGLVDFPTLFRGEEVYLCWKLGEAGIQFWHGVNEGFAGRKQIDREFLDNHRGDKAN